MIDRQTIVKSQRQRDILRATKQPIDTGSGRALKNEGHGTTQIDELFGIARTGVYRSLYDSSAGQSPRSLKLPFGTSPIVFMAAALRRQKECQCSRYLASR